MPKLSSSLAVSLVALTAAVAVSYKLDKLPKSLPSLTFSSSSSSEVLNSAFVFIKPHANTEATQKLVRAKLIEAGITILSESEVDGKTIDEKKLIDQHYYAIASKATILPAEEIPVPADKFEAKFGESWEKVLKEKRACNAMEACERFGCDANELNQAWANTSAVKFGGGKFLFGCLEDDCFEIQRKWICLLCPRFLLVFVCLQVGLILFLIILSYT